MKKTIKDSVSVEEIENFGKTHFLEIIIIAYLIIAMLLTLLFFGPVWSIFLTGIGAITATWLPQKVAPILAKIFIFLKGQGRQVCTILAIVFALVAFFIPPLVFLMLGLFGGVGIHKIATTLHCKESCKTEITKPPKKKDLLEKKSPSDSEQTPKKKSS